jgi:hypothetical protein
VRVALVALGILVVAAPAWAGGGWVPERGSSYVEGSFLFAETDEAYDEGGAVVPFRRLDGVDRPTTWRDAGFVVFGEAGLGGGFGLEGDLLFKRVSVEEPATLFTTDGPADARLALKRGWRTGAWALALSAGARVPMGYDEDEYPSLGSGSVDGFAMAHAGLGFEGGWAQAELGVRTRGGAARDEWPFAAQGGLDLSSRWSAIADLRGHGLLGPGDPAAEDVFDPALASSSIVEVGPGVAFMASRTLRLSGQAWRSLAGRNVPAGWKWKLALAVVR